MAEKKINKRIKRKKRRQKKWLVVILCMIVLALLVAAVFWIKSKRVFTIGSEKVYTDELSFYALQYAYNYHLSSEDMLNEYYDALTTYEEQYKNEVRQAIVDTKVMYQCALQQGIELSEDDQGAIDELVSQTLSDMEVYLDKFHIRKALVKRVLTEQYYAELLKQTIITEEEEQPVYFHTYNLLFPTVKTDEDGWVQANDDGMLISESEEDKQKQYELAMKAVELSKTGLSIEEIAEELGVTANAGDIYGDMEGYDSEIYLQEIDGMAEQSFSSIVETIYGYNVFYLYSKNDKVYASGLSEQEELLAQSALLKTQLEKWYQIVQVDEDKLQSDAWEKFTMKDYVLKR